MNAQESLWERVHAALDARRDPLADEAVRRAARLEPAFGASVERLRARLELLGAVRKSRRRPAVAAALLLLLGGAAWRLHAASRGVPETRGADLADASVRAQGLEARVAPLATGEPVRCAVRSFHALAQTLTPTSRTSVESDGLRSVTSTVQADVPAGPPCLLIASVTSTSP